MGQMSNGDKRTRAKTSDSPKTSRWNDNQFINYNLDKTQQKECKAYVITEPELFDRLSALITDGYRFGVSLDRDDRTFSAFMQARTSEGPNAGYILTGRGSTAFKALKQLLYKHFVCLDGSWETWAERNGDDLIDD